MSSSLILHTNISVNNLQLDYTDVSNINIPASNVIELKTKIPLYTLCTTDLSNNTQSGLLNIQTKNPFSSDQKIDEIENNISEVYMNSEYIKGFAVKLLESLSGEINHGDFPELKFLKNSTVPDFGEVVVRILQHVLVKQLMLTNDSDVVNAYLRNHDTSSNFIANIIINNEHDIKQFITADKSILDTSYNDTIINGTNMLDTSGANIPSRLLNNIYNASKNNNNSSTDYNALSLKKAITRFLFSDKNKITNLRQSYITPLGNDSSLNCIPIQFKNNDEIYFTLNFTGYQIINENGKNLFDNTSNSVPINVTPIYLKLTVEEEVVTENATIELKFGNLNHAWFAAMPPSQQDAFRLGIREDIAKISNIPVNNIEIVRITQGSINVEISITETTNVKTANVANSLGTTSTNNPAAFENTAKQVVEVNVPGVPAVVDTTKPALAVETSVKPQPASGKVVWVRRIGGVDIETTPQFTSSTDGSVYVTLQCSSNLLQIYNDDSGNTTLFKSSGSGANTASDVVITNYDLSGTPIWSRRIGGTGHEYSPQITRSVDGVYVTLQYASNPLQIYSDNSGNTALYSAINNGYDDVCTVKYDLSGTPIWVRRIGGTNNEGVPRIISSNDAIYVILTCSSTSLQIYNGSAVLFTVTGSSSGDIFAVKYDLNGTPMWCRRIGGAGIESNPRITNSVDGVYVTLQGNSSPLQIHSNNTGNMVLFDVSSNNTDDVFTVKYNLSGTPIWCRRIGGTGGEYNPRITSSVDGVYVTLQGSSNPLRIYNNNNGNILLFDVSGSSSGDIFTVKYDLSGTLMWCRRIGGGGSESNPQITNSTDSIYVTLQGSSSPLLIYGNNNGTMALLGVGGSSSTDIFTVRYDLSGTFMWCRRIGGVGTESNPQITCSANDVYVTLQGSSNPLRIYNDNYGNTVLFNVTGDNAYDVFTIRYDVSGTPIWVRRIGGTIAESNPQLTGSADGVSIVLQSSSNPLQIYDDNSGNTALFVVSGSSNTDIFTVRYNSSGTPTWVRRIGGAGNESNPQITSSTNGICVALQCNSNPLQIYDDNNGNTALLNMTGNSSNDIFTVKYDTSGTPIWSRRIGGSGNESNPQITSSSDNVYVMLQYSSSMLQIYNDNSGNTSLTDVTNSGGDDMCIVKYDSSGTPVWVQKISGASTESFSQITSSSDGVYVTLQSNSNPLQIYNGNTVLFSVTGGVYANIFTVKYNSSGTPMWVRRIGGSYDQRYPQILTSIDGSVYTVLQNYSSLLQVYDDNSGNHVLFDSSGSSSTSISDAFIVKYDTSGTPMWVRRFGGTNAERNIRVIIPADNNGMYVSLQSYSNPLQVYGNNNGNITAFNVNGGSGTNSDIFTMKYDTNGTPIWIRRIGGSNNEENPQITKSADGGVYVTMQSSSTNPLQLYTDNNGSSISIDASGTIGEQDVIIVKYNTSGDVAWVRRIGGISWEQRPQTTSSADGSVYITLQSISPNSLQIFVDNSGSSMPLSVSGTVGNSDVVTVKYDSSGTPVWVRRIGGTAHEDQQQINCSTNGGVYVVLQSISSNPLQVFTGNSGNSIPINANGTVGGTDVIVVKYNA